MLIFIFPSKIWAKKVHIIHDNIWQPSLPTFVKSFQHLRMDFQQLVNCGLRFLKGMLSISLRTRAKPKGTQEVATGQSAKGLPRAYKESQTDYKLLLSERMVFRSRLCTGRELCAGTKSRRRCVKGQELPVLHISPCVSPKNAVSPGYCPIIVFYFIPKETQVLMTDEKIPKA